MRPLRLMVGASVIVLFVSLGVVAFPTGASAIAGFCGGAEPCDCGDRVTASRTLICGVDPITSETCTGDGLILNPLTPTEATNPTAPNIILDLGGCTIRGAFAPDPPHPLALNSTAGVRISFYNGATVRRGRITGFGAGVVLDDASSNQVTGLQLPTNTRFGIFSDEGDSNLFASNNVSKMKCGAAGIWVDGGNNTIQLNRVEYNMFDGTEDGAITVTGGLPGEPGANKVSRNIVHLNKGCVSTQSPFAGIAFTDSTGTVEMNRSEYNDYDGFFIGCSDLLEPGNTVTGNKASQNGRRLMNWANGFTVERCGNRIVSNGSNYNDGYGILEVPSPGSPNTYLDNRCTGNGHGKSSPPGLCQ